MQASVLCIHIEPARLRSPSRLDRYYLTPPRLRLSPFKSTSASDIVHSLMCYAVVNPLPLPSVLNSLINQIRVFVASN